METLKDIQKQAETSLARSKARRNKVNHRRLENFLLFVVVLAVAALIMYGLAR